MTVVVDYGMGNVASVLNMLRRIGVADAVLSRKPEDVARAERLVLPGVGAFDRGMAHLDAFGLAEPLRQRALTDGVPTLGICLGAQLLAVARGGRLQVAAPPGREAGVIDVQWRPEAVGDPVLDGLQDLDLADDRRSTPQPSMHADAVVDLPRGATWLASSATYPYQAFRVGSAWGVQFHPEAGPELLAAWAATHDDVDVDAVRAEYARRAEDVAAGGRAVAQAFAALVNERADTMPELV